MERNQSPDYVWLILILNFDFFGLGKVRIG
jgi:hypothetical protein